MKRAGKARIYKRAVKERSIPQRYVGTIKVLYHNPTHNGRYIFRADGCEWWLGPEHVKFIKGDGPLDNPKEENSGRS